MEIKKYTSLFHDGSITSIDYIGNELVIAMESAEVAEEDVHGDIPLSVDDRIKGKLHIRGVSRIEENEKKMSDKLKMKYDDAEIFHLKIFPNRVVLQVAWNSVPPSVCIEDFSNWNIDCEEVIWKIFLIPDPSTGEY